MNVFGSYAFYYSTWDYEWVFAVYYEDFVKDKIGAT